MCEDNPPNAHRQKLFELFEQNGKAISEVTAPFYEIGPGPVERFVPSTDPSVNAAATAKMEQLRDQFREKLTQILKENTKDGAAKIQTHESKPPQPCD